MCGDAIGPAAGVKDSLTTEVLDGLCGKFWTAYVGGGSKKKKVASASNTDHSNVSVWLMLVSLATPARLR